MIILISNLLPTACNSKRTMKTIMTKTYPCTEITIQMPYGFVIRCRCYSYDAPM